jgi:alpha-galactosidase
MKGILTLILMVVTINLSAQSNFTIDKKSLVLDNGYIRREISLSGNRITSSSLSLSGSTDNFLAPGKEFSFSLNGKSLNGTSGWTIVASTPISDDTDGRGVKLTLKQDTKPGIMMELNYMLYPGLPLIRKWIKFINSATEECKIEDLNIEDLETRIGYVHSVIYHNYGRMKHLGRFVGNWDDPVVVVHEISKRRGIAIGNESPGVLKRTAYHTANNNIEAGLTHTGQNFPFRKWLRKGEEWESPRIFICLYSDTDNGFDVINNDVNTFIVRHMNPRIIQVREKPVFVYNTWNPFRTFVNDSLVRDVAKAASECGIQEFIIDDGWQINDSGVTSDKGWGRNYGDWNVDQKKFPGGLKPTFDYIRSLGMKPGLWISIGSATTDSKVYRDHPEWFVKDINNQTGNLHQGSAVSDFRTSCLGTNWFNYIKSTIITLVKDYGLAYAKLDFAVAASAYVNNDTISGCYATDHPFHRDHRESFIVIYERLFKLFDELHKAAPDLFIDCTFETAGKLQLMDYAIAQHAEGNWLSNVENPFPTGQLRVRQLAWWRSPAVPASSLVIGNLQMNEEEFEFSLKSLIGTLPIVLGDPRKIPLSNREMIRKWSEWMQKMEQKYNYMSYRRDLPGFGQPEEGSWDGWARINTGTRSGGIFGIFRQGASEEHRTVVIPDLDPDKIYSIKSAPEGNILLSSKGSTLMEKGFDVSITKKYDGRIFEISAE